MVEDDATIADFVSKGLTEAGHVVDVAADGERGVELAVKGGYDAAIVDVMLPRLDGLALIDRLRARGIHTPVLILSARRTVDDRVKGLQAGGDDYLCGAARPSSGARPALDRPDRADETVAPRPVARSAQPARGTGRHVDRPSSA
jgi:DNA-binding response OmpR family regulator